jgi:hypothetical protein
MAYGEITSYSLRFITAHAHALFRPRDPIDVIGDKTYSSLPASSQDALELARRHRWVLAFAEVTYKFVKSANFLIIVFLLGLLRRKKEGFTSSDRYLLFMFSALFIMSVVYARHMFYFSTRHGLTLVLPWLFFANHGLVWIVEILSRGLNRVTSGWVFFKRYLFHIMTAGLVIVFLVQGVSFKTTDKFIQKEIGLWLKGKGYQGSVVMGPKKFLRLAFYADGRFVEMPDSWEKAIESIRQKEVKIVVIDSCTIEQDCPGFLENWSQAGLLQVKAFKKEKEKCAIQIYGGP